MVELDHTQQSTLPEEQLGANLDAKNRATEISAKVIISGKNSIEDFKKPIRYQNAIRHLRHPEPTPSGERAENKRNYLQLKPICETSLAGSKVTPRPATFGKQMKTYSIDHVLSQKHQQ